MFQSHPIKLVQRWLREGQNVEEMSYFEKKPTCNRKNNINGSRTCSLQPQHEKRKGVDCMAAASSDIINYDFLREVDLL